MLPVPGVGELIKVFLPGESPWAKVIAVSKDGTVVAQIDNRLVGQLSDQERRALAASWFPGAPGPLPSLHNFREGDAVRFKQKNVFDDVWNWVPAEAAPGRS